MPSNNPLPPKEKTLFNRIVKCYEQKQYKNGVKFAKQILSNPKFAEHGETLAMKGLTLNCLGKKEEAYELVKRGLKSDFGSHVCWHVFGLLQRSDKKYDEAIKCYKRALKLDPENLHILRDLSMLQIHTRDMDGHKQTKYTLLQLKPAQRGPWIGYAISNHLLKDYDGAFKVLEEFRKTQQSPGANYEYSELMLYQNLILRQGGHYQQALDHLRENEDKIVDKLTLEEMKGELCIHLNDLQTAEDIFTALIDRNTENVKYYESLEAIFKPQTIEERLEIYDFIHMRYPRADAPRLLPLRFITGDLFEERLDAYLRRQLKRGVPPLLITLKDLYVDPAKVEVIGRLAEKFVNNLRSDSKFDMDDNEDQQPTTLLWALNFYGQHLDAVGEHEKALALLDEAIEHTPTLIEAHVARARCLKHLGDLEGSVISMDEAQSLDTADRFINCKCVRYMIRNGKIKEAAAIAAKFTRENVSVDDYAIEMQCMWYELEIANAHYNEGRLGEALKKCHEIERHFHEITQDQLEFHQYCVRKTTLNAYTKLLTLEDELRQHDFYFQAARIALKIYIQLHDEPYKSDGGNSGINDPTLSSAELKKLKNKLRKQERKAAAEKKRLEQDKKNKQQQKNQKQEEAGDQKKEEEFQPEKLVMNEKPIEAANAFLLPLEQFRPNCFETHHFAFMVAERRGKLLQMLRALLRCRKYLTSDNTTTNTANVAAAAVDQANMAEYHLCKVRFVHKVANSELSPALTEVVHRYIGELELEEKAVEVNGTKQQQTKIMASAESINQLFIANNPHSLAAKFAGARAMCHINASKQKEALMLLQDHYNNNNTTTAAAAAEASSDDSSLSLKLCKRVYSSLRNNRDFGPAGQVDKEATASMLHKKFAEMFTFSNVFGYKTPQPIAASAAAAATDDVDDDVAAVATNGCGGGCGDNNNGGGVHMETEEETNNNNNGNGGGLN